MKKQRAYKSREAILRDIDRAHRRFDCCKHWAVHAEDTARAFLRDYNKVEMDKAKDEAAKHWRAVEHQEKRLKKLGATLAAFDTIPLGVAGLDLEQVVLEK